MHLNRGFGLDPCNRSPESADTLEEISPYPEFSVLLKSKPYSLAKSDIILVELIYEINRMAISKSK